MAKVIDVAAAVIVNPQGETLLSLRPTDAHQGGKWEFPGGKLESGESAEQALSRELREELGIEVLQLEPFLELEYRYPEKRVKLHIFRVLEFTGLPIGLEGQKVEWVNRLVINELKLPTANYPILEKLLALLDEEFA
ncbi:MAG: 8-oxo-dGTP diphosphatase MutT [Gammaproteobacteria bacterium]|nr:MAG: 8-oxo-dGTP diphosphatase MutT [Gammaproteobacteria bacterium]